MKEIAPCKDCTEKHLACHDSCEKYKAWKDRYNAQQKHLKNNRHRFDVPWSASREKAVRTYLKLGDHKMGGDQ